MTQDDNNLPLNATDSHSIETPNGHQLLLARFLWAILGPMLLAIVLVVQMRGPTGRGLISDLLYLVAVVLMIGGRYLEQTSGAGTTLHGEPSQWSDFRRYAIRVPIVAVLLWSVVKFAT